MNGSSPTQGTARQGFGYLLVGGGTALLELAMFQGLYEVIGVPITYSNMVATFVATATNFLLNRNVTFKSTSNPIRSIVYYVILFLANTAISTFSIAAMVRLGIPSAISKVIMQVLVVSWNFVLYRKVIFN